MENDLISRSALIKSLELYGLSNGSSLGIHSGKVDIALQAIEKAPTVDAVEVVRCRECKSFKPCKEIIGMTWTGFCNYGEFHTDEDDFCSRGERRSE